LRGSGVSIAGINTHALISDSTTAASGVGGNILFEGNYTSGGARAVYAGIAGTKENGTDSDYAGNLKFYTRANGSLPALAMTITSSQRVGIGTTSPSGRLTIENDAALNELEFTGSNYTNIYSSTTQGFDIGISNASSAGPLRFLTANAERARIDSSGRLLVGTSSTSADHRSLFQSTPADTSGFGSILVARGTSTGLSDGSALGVIAFSDSGHVKAAQIGAFVDGGYTSGTDQPSRLVFSTTADGASSPTERMRISSTGKLNVFDSSGAGLRVNSAIGSSSTDNVFTGFYGASSTTAEGTASIAIRTNGDVRNTNNSYGALSDVKLKENIADANSQWDDLKAVRVRNFNFKEGQTHRQIGVIAQELELVSPGLVSESPDFDADGNDLGTVTKSVNYSVLYMKAVKALQEAMERIEVLEQRLTDAGIA
jgi:hypothetical protein